MSSVVIVGGGIIGLFTAYYLSEEGFEVTILDKGDLSNSCSIGNAGMIVPSHIVPLASPGIITKGLKWMFSSTSPFYIHPKLDLRLAQWCLLFYKAATKIEKGQFDANHFANVVLQAKLNPSANMTLRFNDPFGTQRFRVRAGDDKVFQFTEHNVGARMVFLAFNYSYGRPPKVRAATQDEQAAGGFGPPG